MRNYCLVLTACDNDRTIDPFHIKAHGDFLAMLYGPWVTLVGSYYGVTMEGVLISFLTLFYLSDEK